MSTEPKSTIEAELEMLEKLHRLGDEKGTRIIARRLLISQTLTEDDKRRIDRVINASKFEAMTLVVIVIAIVVFIYVYSTYVM